MVSTIAWLDTSADEQRRIREMIALFSQGESRDELGIGQIRDVFSDTLFPGTSVIQTRARYFLIVPWAFKLASERGRSGQDLLAHATNTERRLVEVLRDAGVSDGLIGLLAGKSVKILPSAIYWSGLRTFGILVADKSPDSLTARITRPTDDTDELATRLVGDWHPTLPPAPLGFPKSLDGGLEIEPSEADWLREQIMAAVPGTLLAHLVMIGQAPDSDSSTPWLDTACQTAPEGIRDQIRHAELFSLVIQGAALLYNLLIAERYEAAGLSLIAAPVDRYRTEYQGWREQLHNSAVVLKAWKRDEFWIHIRDSNPRVSEQTRKFVDTWIDAVLDGSVVAGADDARLRMLVGAREQSIKKSQSRLTNDKLLGDWSGGSGSGQLTYRWRQVRRIITDIQGARNVDAGT